MIVRHINMSSLKGVVLIVTISVHLPFWFRLRLVFGLAVLKVAVAILGADVEIRK